MAIFSVKTSVSVTLFVVLGVLPAVAQEASSIEDSPSVKLERIGRITSLGGMVKGPEDLLDREIYSPKSAAFSPSGDKLYINSLEGASTQVYTWPSRRKLRTISHRFGPQDAALFHGEETVFEYPYFQKRDQPNVFSGKPVEMSFSHGGRYLWVTYYRRSYDPSALSPGAVAIVDTRTDRIVRVMPTGPIPKYVTASPDGKFVAITHWGDNTIALIDVQGEDPSQFKFVQHLVVEKKLSQAQFAGKNRDANCGFCLRGTVFTNDGRYLFVARMTGGGIAGFDVETGKYLGTLDGMAPTPRHLAITPDGKTLVLTSNSAGRISKIDVERAVSVLREAGGRRIYLKNWKSVAVGTGARTLDIAQDGRTAFVAVNRDRSVVAVDLETMKVISRLKADPYPVGLAVSRDGKYLAVTSQGRAGHGGNMVTLIQTRPDSN